MRLLIIGNGIAALSAAEHFRKNNSETEVLILSEDSSLTYYRIKLSHYLGKPAFQEEELLVKDLPWYQEKGITVVLNTRVDRIDFTKKEAVTRDGDCYDYDQLLLAHGAQPFVPPISGSHRPGVFTLRSLEDLKNIRAFMEDKERVVVIGGGLLGLEAAHGLVELGKKVTVLEYFQYLLPKQLDQELSRIVQSQLEREGISFTLEAECEAILGDESVSGIRLKSGNEIPADAVIISAGVRPNLETLQGSPLVLNKGIVVNERMETNLPGVYAAGDVAECHGTVFGLWTAANEQGKIAGSNLAGKDLTYAVPELAATLNIGDVKLFSIGDVGAPDSVLSFQDEKVCHRLFVKGGVVVGAALIGDLSLMLKAKTLVTQKKEVLVSGAGEDVFKELMK